MAKAAKLHFDAGSLRDGFTLLKVVKPVTGDYCLKFVPDGVIMFSYDKRRYSRVMVLAEGTELPPDFVSDDFYLTVDRASLFESGLDSFVVSLNERSVSVKATGEGQSRQASLKRRSLRTKRMTVPDDPDANQILEMDASVLEALLKQMSCSALIKQTKTEEDMRVNQVHFFPEGPVISSARFFATVADVPGLSVDLSLISADIPGIRSLCAKAPGKVALKRDKSRIYAVDSASGSCVAFSRVAARKPPVSHIDNSKFVSKVTCGKNLLTDALSWASTAVEGTQRVTFHASAGKLSLSTNSEEITQIDCAVEGSDLRADFPVRHLFSIVGYVESDDVVFHHGHSESELVLGIGPSEPPEGFSYMHYINSMVSR